MSQTLLRDTKESKMLSHDLPLPDRTREWSYDWMRILNDAIFPGKYILKNRDFQPGTTTEFDHLVTHLHPP